MRETEVQTMPQETLPEHRWLQKLVGEWTVESDCETAPGQPWVKETGTEVVRAFGDFWTVAEGVGGTADNGWKSMTTLGYNPDRKRFVGTFIATMMTHLWVYDGALDTAGKVLTLDAEGPNFTDGKMAKYQDIIEFVSDDHRTLASRILREDGQWHSFMKAHYRRTAR
jgi:hypothetical protein